MAATTVFQSALRQQFILINPLGGAERGNARGLRQASDWLQSGGLLAVFPAGEVSHIDFRRRGISDPVWHDSAVRLARRPFPSAHPGSLLNSYGVEDLDQLVREIEPDGKGLPVLVRQYLRIGRRLCMFHLDRRFGNCLDGLIVVDLLKTEPRQSDRYLGAAGAEGLLKHHQVGAGSVR